MNSDNRRAPLTEKQAARFGRFVVDWLDSHDDEDDEDDIDLADLSDELDLICDDTGETRPTTEQMMNDIAGVRIIVCELCQQKNRLPVDKTGNCGKCKAPLEVSW